MKHLRSLIFSLAVPLTALPPLFAYGPKITPENMAAHALAISASFRPVMIKEGEAPERATGMVVVQLTFEPQGDGIRRYQRASLDVKDVVWAPIEMARDPKTTVITSIQFQIQANLIDQAVVVLEEPFKEIRASDCRIDLGAFRDKNK